MVMDNIAPDEAREALSAVNRARANVAEQVGLPRWYWWLMAAAWVALGVIGDTGPKWLVIAATLAVGATHSALASRLLSGQRRTDLLKVSANTAGGRTPIIVIVMLLALAALTVAAALTLHADGARHPATWASLVVASIVGFGGPEILATLRRWASA